MKWDTATENDRRIITRQIKRLPRNLLGVARRCERQCPQVLVNHPLLREAEDAFFFPTLFWLSCPAAVSHISRMEDQGFIQQIQEQLHPGSDLFERWHHAQLEYIYLRNAAVDSAILLEMRTRQDRLISEMDQRGIGGVGDWFSVKCLHMHYAHYLVTHRNPVGQLVDKMLRLTSFDAGCRQCWLAANNASSE